MENDKITIIKCYKATEEDWRNPNVYIDTDPSSPSESENESTDEYHTPLNVRKKFYFKNTEGHDDKEPLVKIPALNVKPESTSEKSINSFHQSSEVPDQSKSPDSSMLSDSDDKTEKKKYYRYSYAQSLFETTARFARFPFRNYIWGHRNSTAAKNSD